MKFKDTGNTHDSLTHYANSLLGFAEGSTTEYSVAAMARAANTWKYKVALWIWAAQDAWDWDDDAHTDFGIATTTLVDDQQDYGLPTDALRIKEVSIKDSGGIFHKLRAIDEKEVNDSLDEFQKTKGLPVFYRLFKQSLFIYPAPKTSEVTESAGLKIYFHREINEFTGSTTTTEIGIFEPGDRLIAMGVALEFALKRSMEVKNDLYLSIYGGIKHGIRIKGLKDEIEDHVSRRTEEIEPNLKPLYPFKDRNRYI